MNRDRAGASQRAGSTPFSACTGSEGGYAVWLQELRTARAAERRVNDLSGARRARQARSIFDEYYGTGSPVIDGSGRFLRASPSYASEQPAAEPLRTRAELALAGMLLALGFLLVTQVVTQRPAPLPGPDTPTPAVSAPLPFLEMPLAP